MDDTVKGEGWLLFAGIMVLIAGILNTIWGIAAIDKASFFVEDERYIIEDLSTMGWFILIIGVVQLFAAFSIWSGGGFGRWIGIISASFSAVGALLVDTRLPALVDRRVRHRPADHLRPRRVRRAWATGPPQLGADPKGSGVTRRRAGPPAIVRVLLVLVITAGALMLLSALLAGLRRRQPGGGAGRRRADRPDQRAGLAAPDPDRAAVHRAHARARRARAQRRRRAVRRADRARRDDRRARRGRRRRDRPDGGQHRRHLAARDRRRRLLVPQRRQAAQCGTSGPRAT